MRHPEVLAVFGEPRRMGYVVAVALRGARRARTSGGRLPHLPPSGPITRLGRYVEISGTKHSTTTASIISSTNGSVPQITSLKGISGATLRMTKIFRPTGGGISPPSITIVMTTADQMNLEFAPRRGGRRIRAGPSVIRNPGPRNPSNN